MLKELFRALFTFYLFFRVQSVGNLTPNIYILCLVLPAERHSSKTNVLEIFTVQFCAEVIKIIFFQK